MENLMDISVSGGSKISGGEYRDVHVSGSAKIEGNLRCRSMHCSGSAKVEGDVDCAGEGIFSGSGKIEGNAAFERLSTSGSTKIEGDLECRDLLKTSGVCTVGGGVHCREGKISGVLDARALRGHLLSISGTLNVEEGVEAEAFKASGALNIPGLLNAERIEISMEGVKRMTNFCCNIGSIGCSELRVFSESEWRGFFGKKPPMLNVNTIEGDVVALENTQAETVRGRNVHIGAGCEIGRVEYTETLEISNSAQVREEVKI